MSCRVLFFNCFVMSEKDSGRTYTQKEVIRMLSELFKIFNEHIFGFEPSLPWEGNGSSGPIERSGFYSNLLGKSLTLLEVILPEGARLDAAKSTLRSSFSASLEETSGSILRNFVRAIEQGEGQEVECYHPWYFISELMKGKEISGRPA
jgi:hypothetical protein